ncbi:unnamed protein product [Blepharisma stoltei]|uniref:Uncharacterized protein n=1 Tax=Blepharisma stoltei TaxID=1481888 RepID=A0AAU9JYI0_9CILI|nr:unnamed protein product [Blepharisma stoltei]
MDSGQFQTSKMDINELAESYSRIEDFEKRVAQCEKAIQMQSYLSKIKKDQQEARFLESNRKFGEFHKRLKRIEENMYKTLLDVGLKLSKHDNELLEAQKISEIKDDIEEIKYKFKSDDPFTRLDSDIGDKIKNVAETMKEFRGEIEDYDRKIARLKEKIKNIKDNTQEGLLRKLQRQVNDLYEKQDEELTYLEQNNVDIEKAEEEIFLSSLHSK